MLLPWHERVKPNDSGSARVFRLDFSCRNVPFRAGKQTDKPPNISLGTNEFIFLIDNNDLTVIASQCGESFWPVGRNKMPFQLVLEQPSPIWWPWPRLGAGGTGGCPWARLPQQLAWKALVNTMLKPSRWAPRKQVNSTLVLPNWEFFWNCGKNHSSGFFVAIHDKGNKKKSTDISILFFSFCG